VANEGVASVAEGGDSWGRREGGGVGASGMGVRRSWTPAMLGCRRSKSRGGFGGRLGGAGQRWCVGAGSGALMGRSVTWGGTLGGGR
jgi:hypothetical protein